MDKKDLVRRLVTRTGLSHDAVTAVLTTMEQIAKEQVGAYEDLTVPGIARIRCWYDKPRKRWEMHVDVHRGLRAALGSLVVAQKVE